MTMVLIIVVTNWESQNSYKIRNSLGQQVYFAKEGTCERTLEIVDLSYNLQILIVV